LLGDDRPQRLLAVEAADRRGRAAIHHPGLGLVGRVDLVQLPHRALLRIARVLAPRPRRVGRHAPDLLLHLGRFLAHRDRVAVALAHLRAVEPGQLQHLGVQRLRLAQDGPAGAADPGIEPLAIGRAQRRTGGEQGASLVQRFLAAFLLEGLARCLERPLRPCRAS
jgi:hypothetical protein